MKILMWNWQGLGKPLTVHSLKGICKSHSPEVVVLCKTKNQPSIVENTILKCGYSNSFCVNLVGAAGGLVVGWKDHIQISIQEHDGFFIYFKILDQVQQLEWGVFAVHLHSKKRIRQPQFEKLLELTKQAGEKNYIIFGDFNVISSNQEKEGVK